MRRGTLITIVALFVLLLVAAAYQGLSAKGPRRFPGPGFKPADALACRAQGREHDDRDAGFLAGNPGHGGAVHVWQHQIENHQCWLGLPHELERGQTIGGDHYLEAGPFEIKPDQVRDLGVVVDDQHKVLATWYGFQITHNGDREPD